MVPAGVGGDPACLRQHVAVEEEENVVGGGADPRVARPGRTESAMFLSHHPDVERRGRRPLERHARAVVDDHDLGQLARGQSWVSRAARVRASASGAS